MILTADPSLCRAGPTLLGGSPLRLLRLTGEGMRLLDGWLAGAPVGDDPRAVRLARRLLDAGLVHPVGTAAGRYGAADVTVVVPVRDDPAGVATVLAATGDVTSRIVVDDGSPTPLPGATLRHATSLGPAAARNTGWRHATTDLIAFLDADVTPEPGWLDTILPLFDDPAVAAVAPRVRSIPGRGVLSRYEADRGALDLGPDPAEVRPLSRVSYVPSAALVLRRDVLSAVGGFDEEMRFGEDVDLVWRIVDTGGVVRYQPSATVWHRPRPTVRAWARQRYHYGTSAASLANRHPRRVTPARFSPRATTASPQLVRTLRANGFATAPAVAVAARRQFGVATMLAEAIRRTWWPLALLTRRGRKILLAALFPCLLDALRTRRGPRWLALRIADDVSYSAGVWVGSLRRRTPRPLLPQLARNDQ
ncbi:MAG: mycofactocin system glycosyltransferase [Actinophytocola sp.]|nr:mycofactocin system glycosyltransferase [Actinophytocola sp.]